MYGAQARQSVVVGQYGFENDVEMYGAQAFLKTYEFQHAFENDVEMYGAQADHSRERIFDGLRMM